MVDLNSTKITKESDFSKLKETHITLAGFKFYFTDMIFKGIEKCRLACGGHGYHHFSQLPSLRQESTANITLEGENTVMTLQVARYLVKQMAKAKKGTLKKDKEFMDQIGYIINYKQYLSKFVKVASYQALLDLGVVEDLLAIPACKAIGIKPISASPTREATVPIVYATQTIMIKRQRRRTTWNERCQTVDFALWRGSRTNIGILGIIPISLRQSFTI